MFGEMCVKKRQSCSVYKNEIRIKDNDAYAYPEFCVGKNIFPVVYYHPVKRGNTEKDDNKRHDNKKSIVHFSVAPYK